MESTASGIGEGVALNRGGDAEATGDGVAPRELDGGVLDGRAKTAQTTRARTSAMRL